MRAKRPKIRQLCLMGEICNAPHSSRKRRDSYPEGRIRMLTAKSRRTRLSFERPSQYPLPHGLLIGF